MLAATPPDATTSETVAPTPALLLAQATLALEALGAGFLGHASNTELRSRIATGLLKPEEYQRQLLWLLYQLLTSLLLESRGLTSPLPTQWLEVTSVFRNLDAGNAAQKFRAIAGLFEARHCPDLGSAALDEPVLLHALSLLTNFPSQSPPQRVNKLPITSRQLAGLYEALLELKPAFSSSGAFQYARDQQTQASSRRSRGSYYTPDHLIQIVLDQALEPLIAEVMATPAPAQTLLELSIVDPACGAGHFLLAAAKRLALHLARIEGNSSPEGARDALGRVSSQCIFGVDLDDLAVELCKLNLWLEAASVPDSATPSTLNIRCGHALLGAPAEVINAEGGRLAADAWCAQFFMSERESRGARRNKKATVASARQARELAQQYHFFHWQLCFPEVFAKGGFDLILGNPPWIAHAGRAAQGLPHSVKRFYKSNYEAFADYPTTHGLFASVLPRYLRTGGRLGLVVPSSLAELGGYQPARRAHDRLCDIAIELTDFGEGQFEGVTQPCMALVSQRSTSGRTAAPLGEAWPVARPDLSATDRALLDRLKLLEPLPAELFGERGLQSDPSLSVHFRKAAAAEGSFTTPLREGTDVREFEVLTPRYHVDAAGLGSRLRSAAEYREVRLVVRQTARYPIAALSDGMAFRNSLLAGFASSEWPAETLVALLNSTLIRWLHFQRFRDARQPVLPQVKVAHLRAIPAPAQVTQPELAELSRLGLELSNGISPESNAVHRDALEALVSAIYGLSLEEREAVAHWHARFHLSPKKATH